MEPGRHSMMIRTDVGSVFSSSWHGTTTSIDAGKARRRVGPGLGMAMCRHRSLLRGSSDCREDVRIPAKIIDEFRPERTRCTGQHCNLPTMNGSAHSKQL